jgi:hypothetical protein
VAVLGTLAEFHREPIPYDLAALVRLVTDLGPDLLCLDMTPEQWRRRDFGGLPPEYRDALLPLAHQTDIVVVPIAEQNAPNEPTVPRWRGRIIAVLRQWLAYLERTAPGPDAINGGVRHFLANLLYYLIVSVSGGDARRAVQLHTDHLIQKVLDIVQHDPGRRVLVVVNVQHCHHIRPALRKHQIRVVRYSEL